MPRAHRSSNDAITNRSPRANSPTSRNASPNGPIPIEQLASIPGAISCRIQQCPVFFTLTNVIELQSSNYTEIRAAMVVHPRRNFSHSSEFDVEIPAFVSRQRCGLRLTARGLTTRLSEWSNFPDSFSGGKHRCKSEFISPCSWNTAYEGLEGRGGGVGWSLQLRDRNHWMKSPRGLP